MLLLVAVHEAVLRRLPPRTRVVLPPAVAGASRAVPHLHRVFLLLALQRHVLVFFEVVFLQNRFESRNSVNSFGDEIWRTIVVDVGADDNVG